MTANFSSKISHLCLAAGLLLGTAGLANAALAASSGYHVTKKFVLGGEGSWDFITLDPAGKRLFIARGDHMQVVDVKSGKLLNDMTGFNHVHGALFAGTKGYIIDGGANTVVVFDPQTLRKTGHIAVGTKPDNILYDPANKRLFTFNAGSADASVIDTKSGKLVGTVPLGGKPEAALLKNDGVILVNIEDKNEIVAFDATSLAIKGHWPLAPCEEPSGIAIDAAHTRVFSGCGNNILSVVDAKTGKLVTTAPIGGGVDGNRFDPETGLIFSANGGSGTMSVLRMDSADKISVLDNVPTAKHARTLELNPKTHKIYTVAATLVPVPPTAEQPHPRPVAAPGSFELLVLGR